MKKTFEIIVITLILGVFTLACINKKPEEIVLSQEALYDGPLDGNYTSSDVLVERCYLVKECMEIESEAGLPMLRGYGGGNSVVCGEGLSPVCYEVNPEGSNYIILSQGTLVQHVLHACVHHWLYETTGDADAAHTSENFLKCSGATLSGDIVTTGTPEVIIAPEPEVAAPPAPED